MTLDAQKNPRVRTAPDAEWHHLDADGQVLGRIAAQAASLLIGKHRVDVAPHRVPPVYVVITNTDTVALTGRKEEQKLYRRYTGYPGGLRARTVADQRQRDSRRLLELAIFGMLPKNNLRAQYMRHLKLYAGKTHPHEAQISQPA